jgi:hypothetical protein
MCCCVSSVVKCGHGLDPLGKIIYFYNNVLVSITGWRMESHEIYAPFTKGFGCDDWV